MAAFPVQRSTGMTGRMHAGTAMQTNIAPDPPSQSVCVSSGGGGGVGGSAVRWVVVVERQQQQQPQVRVVEEERLARRTRLCPGVAVHAWSPANLDRLGPTTPRRSPRE